MTVAYSLLVSGALTYAALVILGREIGFTLTLAGIAGFIVAIGIRRLVRRLLRTNKKTRSATTAESLPRKLGVLPPRALDVARDARSSAVKLRVVSPSPAARCCLLPGRGDRAAASRVHPEACQRSLRHGRPVLFTCSSPAASPALAQSHVRLARFTGSTSCAEPQRSPTPERQSLQARRSSWRRGTTAAGPRTRSRRAR